MNREAVPMNTAAPTIMNNIILIVLASQTGKPLNSILLILSKDIPIKTENIAKHAKRIKVRAIIILIYVKVQRDN